jgi:hypothetical protein
MSSPKYSYCNINIVLSLKYAKYDLFKQVDDVPDLLIHLLDNHHIGTNIAYTITPVLVLCYDLADYQMGNHNP